MSASKYVSHNPANLCTNECIVFWGEIAEFYHQHQSSFIIFLYVGLLVYLIWDLKFSLASPGPTDQNHHDWDDSDDWRLGADEERAPPVRYSWVRRRWPLLPLPESSREKMAKTTPKKQTQIGFGIVDLLWPAFLLAWGRWTCLKYKYGKAKVDTKRLLHLPFSHVFVSWIIQIAKLRANISFSFLKGKALASEPLSTLQDVIWFY